MAQQAGWGRGVWGRAGLRSDSQFLTKLKLEVGYFTGRAWQSRDIGGAGVILRFARILPRRSEPFSPSNRKRLRRDSSTAPSVR